MSRTLVVPPVSEDEAKSILRESKGPGGPNPAAGDASGYTLVNTQHAVYRGSDNQVHELWWDGQWHHNNLSIAAGNPPAAAGDASGYILANTQHVVYRGSDSKVHELWWNGQWHHNDLSIAAGNAPAAAGDASGYILANTQHVVYRGTDNQIHELWWDGQWHHNNLSVAAGNAPTAAGDASGYILANTQHVVYRGSDSKVHELWWNGQWHHNDLSIAAGNAPAAAGDASGYILANTQHVVYRGSDSAIHELWWDGQWHHNNLSVAAGNAPAAVGNPAGYILANTQHVVYRGIDTQIHELWWDGQWHHNNLSIAAGNAPAAAGDPSGYILANTQHVVYRGSDNRIHELWWDGQWHHNNLSLAASLKILNVELIPQQTNMWCWAASAEMIMKYEGHDVSQCNQANHEFGRTDCCISPTPSACVNGGWAEFNAWGFNNTQTNSGVALTFVQLQAQIDGNMPIWYVWWWTGGGGHAMVVSGYYADLDTVYINDPWPPNTGDTRWISYADYVAQAGHHYHGVDYYNIRYTGAGTPGAGALEEVPAMKPESIGTAPTGYGDAENAAREALKMFPMLVTPNNAREMGFDSVPTDQSSLSLGDPLPVFYIRHDALKAHSGGDDVRKLLTDGEELVYPVIKDGKAISSVVVANLEGAWRFRSLGDHNLVKALVEVRARQVGFSGKDPSSYFIVHIPSMYCMFIGHNDAAGKLILTPIHDHREVGLVSEGTQPAEQVIQAIVLQAREDRHAIPPRK